MKVPSKAWILIVAMVFAGLLPAARALSATVWYVSPGGSDGSDCLSPATACASMNGALDQPSLVAGDTVNVAVGTYTGTGTEVVLVNKGATLSGGWDSAFTTQTSASTIDGEHARTGIRINNVTVTIDRFTIQHGYDISFAGGGIGNIGGHVTVSHSTIINNVSSYPDGAALGGGIYNVYGVGAATLNVIKSVISGNVGDFGGGGIYNGASLATLTDSRVSDNTAGKLGYSGGGGGGGIYNFNGTLMVNHSTVSHNTVLGYFYGSGIEAHGPVTLNNSTVSGNTGGAFGEGVYSFGQTVDLNNSTISSNQSYGIYNQAGIVNVKNTIMANHGSSDCYNDPSYSGVINSLGYNLVENHTNCTLAGSDLTTMTPQLGPLQDNGGPTPTHTLLPGSPAIDAGSPDCPPPATDQRGVARPQGMACDIGAYESVPTDIVSIRQAVYVPAISVLFVSATSSAAPDAALFVTVADCLTSAPMRRRSHHYVFLKAVEPCGSLDGHSATITSSFGGSSTATIR